MAITASISVEPLTDPSKLKIVDDTPNEGTETYTNRYLTILDSTGSALTGYPNPIAFSFAGFPTNEITLEGFTEDKALNIVMTLVPTVVVVGSTYTAVADVAMTRFLQRGLYDLQISRFLDNEYPAKANDTAQIDSIDLIIEERNANTAVQFGSLIGAQNALIRAGNIIDNLQP